LYKHEFYLQKFLPVAVLLLVLLSTPANANLSEGVMYSGFSTSSGTTVSVRRALASNSAIDRELQVKLAQDEDVSVRRTLAGNPAIVRELLVKQAEDEDVSVRGYLASNPAIVPGIQAKLAEDKQPEVRSALVSNSSFWRSRDEVNQ
jgi:hypothetical protein